MSYLDELNPAQREAAVAKDCPVIIMADSAEGKQLILTYRIAHLLHNR